MKKILVLFLLGMLTATLLMSCSTSRTRGCPTTNPRYFRM